MAVAPTDAQGAPTDAPDDAQGGAAPAASAAPAGGKPPTPERAYRIALMEAIRAERGGPPPQHDAEWAATRRFWRLAEGGVPVERVVACYRAERRRPTWDSKPLPLQSVATVYPVYASDPAAFAAGVTRARRATQGAYERQTPPNTRGATHDPASQRPGPPPDHTPRPAPPDSAHGAPDAPGSAVEDASRAAIRERAAAARAARAGGQ